MTSGSNGKKQGDAWDHTTHTDFYQYYAAESQSAATLQRFSAIQSVVLRIAAKRGLNSQLDVADVGCGAGTQSQLWAKRGHRVFALDVNEPLIRLARERAKEAGYNINFEVGTATALPWPDRSIDICIMPELLEHVTDWKSCIEEAARIVRPGGLLYLSTTNMLCPVQQEFNLPLYSWYPGPLKRYCERLAVTTQPALANYAKYPAVNWFTYYGLRNYLKPLGFSVCLDRFDLIDPSGKGSVTQTVLRLLQQVRLLRFFGHVFTPSTFLLAVRL
jgi:2-polyprenyl-3-methyl-5-hydroxy-6-metoxy-1,4-benzoquinol methylase